MAAPGHVEMYADPRQAQMYASKQAAGMSSACSLGQDAPRELQVVLAITVLQEEICNLEKTAAAMEQRLFLVLQPCGPAAAEKNPEPQKEIKAPLAENIDETTATARAIYRRLIDVMDRLEV